MIVQACFMITSPCLIFPALVSLPCSWRTARTSSGSWTRKGQRQIRDTQPKFRKSRSLSRTWLLYKQHWRAQTRSWSPRDRSAMLYSPNAIPTSEKMPIPWANAHPLSKCPPQGKPCRWKTTVLVQLTLESGSQVSPPVETRAAANHPRVVCQDFPVHA